MCRRGMRRSRITIALAVVGISALVTAMLVSDSSPWHLVLLATYCVAMLGSIVEQRRLRR